MICRPRSKLTNTHVTNRRRLKSIISSFPERTVGRALGLTKLLLAHRGCDTYSIDAELLVGHAVGLTRSELLINTKRNMELEQISRLVQMVKRRCKREPVSYIVGSKEFWGRDFVVNPSVLIPRPCTELLVEYGLKYMKERSTGKLLELGVGSGCVTISLMLELPPGWTAVATDISAEALKVARLNAERHGVAHRIEFIESDWISHEILKNQQFHLVVSNPPYLTDWDMENLTKDLQYEPRTALAAGEDGLDAYRCISRFAEKILYPQGVLILETGSWQLDSVIELFQKNAPKLEVLHRLKDLEAFDRAVVFRRM